MFSNYFYLNRCVKELNWIVSGEKIYEIFSQEKNKLLLNISSPENPDAHIEISADQNQPYFVYKSSHHKAKKNTVNFFEEILPAKILNIEIAVIDRIIKFNLDNSSLYFLIRGPRTNIVIKQKDELFLFKKKYSGDSDSIKKELEQTNFSDQFIYPDFSEFEDYSFAEIKKEFPFLQKEIINEAKVRWKEGESKNEILSQIISEVYNSKIRISADSKQGKVYIRPVSFYDENISSEEKLFDDYSDALQYFVSREFKWKKEFRLKKETSDFLIKRLGKISNKLNNLKTRIESGSKEDIYKNYGTLLLTYKNKLQKGMKEISLDDFTGQEVKIPLDEKLSPQENIDNYFDKSRAERINYKTSIELFEETEKEYHLYKTAFEKFEASETLNELEVLRKEFGLDKKKNKVKMDDNFNYRRFLIDDKYHLFVGKDGKSNDYLSVKFSKQNDYWFHARGLPGSHVLLRSDNPKDGIPKNVLQTAAAVAAFYSKAKTAGLAPVAYTFAKYVSKKKGMEPGKVSVMKEKVLMVKPEIPENCKPVND